MKKISAILAGLVMAFSLTACSNNAIQNSEASATGTLPGTINSSETPSSSGENSAEIIPESSLQAESGESEQSIPESDDSEPATPAQSKSETQSPTAAEENKSLVVYFTWSSNTAGMADAIAELTGADKFEIIPVTPYTEEYTPCTEVALEERDSNARPAIQNLPADISEYDNILIGYPIWWHTAPMIIGTFLENYDLAGKEIYPFAQSASMDIEQFEQSMEFVRGCAVDANVHDGLFTRPSDTNTIASYLEQNGLTI